jgi:hypothetical protein
MLRLNPLNFLNLKQSGDLEKDQHPSETSANLFLLGFGTPPDLAKNN